MAFEFKRKESVRKGLRRLGRRRAEKALDHLEHCERLEAVHEVRKEIKRLRALLRLVRPGMTRSEYRSCTNTLREAAAQLGPARDAHVRVNALADLSRHFQHELSAHPFSHIRQMLAANRRKAQTALSQNHGLEKVRRLLHEFMRDICAVKLKTSGWNALSSALKRAYSNGRRSYRLAREEETSENFHEWRKRAKDLMYQLALLCPIWPEQMAAAKAELKTLGQWLGEDHDLFLLTGGAAIKLFKECAGEEAEALAALSELRLRRLRPRSLALGARFYEEKPAVFCRRLHRYWKNWRREATRQVTSDK